MGGFVTDDMPMTAERLNLLLPQFGLLSARLVASSSIENVVYVISDTYEWYQVQSGAWVKIIAANPADDVPGLRTLDGTSGAGATGDHAHDVVEVDVAESTVAASGSTSFSTRVDNESGTFISRISVSQTVTANSSVSLVGMSTVINTSSEATYNLQLRRGTTVIATTSLTAPSDTSNPRDPIVAIIEFLDENPGAGTHSYSVHSQSLPANNIRHLTYGLVAREIRTETI